MKTQSAKAKGRNLQKFLAQWVTRHFKLQEGDVESRSMGAGGVDLMLSPAAREVFPVSIESKNTRKRPGPAALKQASENAYSGTVPAVAWKPHRHPMHQTLVMMSFEDLLNLIDIVGERSRRDRNDEKD